ncbi:MAG: transcriptional repressor LexA [Anaerolineales bacterium]|nr:transcriptional repressor LexA [Anaerolineales bacterium]
MAKRRKGLSERHKKILDLLERYQEENGYPPSIREIGKQTGISSTSVVNYYLNQLEEEGYIERDRKISRGVRLVKGISNAANAVREAIEDLIKVPVVGRIVAGSPMPVPGSDFAYYDQDSGVEIARSLLGPGDKEEDLFALEVQGDSMVDAMVNDGDIVVMKKAQDARNGEMVAVWLTDRDETTLKYFYKENGGIRLQPANPTMQPIFVENPRAVQVQGKVVMVIRQMGPAN